MRRAVFHIDQDEDGPFVLGLNNITNLLNAIDGEYRIVMLANGPGVRVMTRDRCAQHMDMIRDLAGRGVAFHACAKALERFEVDREELIAEAEVVPSGIVALIDMQHDGFAYIKP